MEIKKGQIWQDYDCRFRNATPTYKRILRVTKTHAYVEGFVVNLGIKKSDLDNEKIISKSRIRLDRFKPNSNGYKYIRET